MLSTKYRFTNLDDMAPTTNLVSIHKMLDEDNVPSTMILHGPPGTGKTNIARLIASSLLELDNKDTKTLVCSGSKSGISGYIEHDMTRFGKADDVRKLASIIENISNRTLYSTPTVFILDEFDAATEESQKRLVKVIDDETASNIYMIIITNHYDKLARTIESRSVGAFKFHELTRDFALKFLIEISRRENKPLTSQVAEQIYSTNTYHAPRDLLMSLEGYYLTGSVSATNESSTGIISELILSIDALSRCIHSNSIMAGKDSATTKLSHVIERMLKSKPGLDAVIQSIAKYYDSVLHKDTSYRIVQASSYTLNFLIKHKADELRGYPYIDLMRMFYSIAEERAHSGFYDK